MRWLALSHNTAEGWGPGGGQGDRVRKAHLGDLPLVKRGLQDLVVLDEVVLELCVEVDLFHGDFALPWRTRR